VEVGSQPKVLMPGAHGLVLRWLARFAKRNRRKPLERLEAMKSKVLGSLLLFPQLGSHRGPAFHRSVWNWIFSLRDSTGFVLHFFLPYSVVKR
jgi:hypothetical protein